jgi:hypothetical protein
VAAHGLNTLSTQKTNYLAIKFFGKTNVDFYNNSGGFMSHLASLASAGHERCYLN